ncbi:MAG: hypothetical protein CMF12_00985 [Idiomarina sp.]|uniref:hypothetical protein n=1 Tax=Idiomarina sp. TaxID=1874361 RepID=UPI000C435317|nr:hypothetical protein [Idiomarina sp.]MBT41074.1 hypothetical protein [Idiomarina sp.]
MNSKGWLLPGVVIVAVSVVANYFVTRWIDNNQLIPAIQKELTMVESNQPKIVTINTEKTIERLQDAGNEPMEIMTGLALLTEMLKNDGVVLLDEQLVLSSSERFKLDNLSLDTIFQMAEERGIDVDKRIEDSVKQAEKAAKERLAEMEELLSSMER